LKITLKLPNAQDDSFNIYLKFPINQQ